MQLDQFVDRLEISLSKRSFKIFGSNCEIREVFCDNGDQFISMLGVTKAAAEIDKVIKVVYV